jgi:hypothetical protein
MPRSDSPRAPAIPPPARALRAVWRENRGVVARLLVIFLAFSGLLVAVLVAVRDPGRWPAPERRPQQGEAVDPATARTARPIHAAAALDRLIREPQNTWTNLAFVLGGAFLLSAASQRLGRGTGLALIAVGIGSFLYHASAATAFRHVDVGAMYWLFLVSLLLCVAALSPRWRDRLEARAGVVVAVTLAVAIGIAAARNSVVLGFKPLSLRPVTALTAAVVILSLAEIARRRETIRAALELLGVVTVFGLAAACQTLDRPGEPWYRPEARVQAHAVWHVLAAASFVWAARLLDQAAADRGGRGPAG